MLGCSSDDSTSSSSNEEVKRDEDDTDDESDDTMPELLNRHVSDSSSSDDDDTDDDDNNDRPPGLMDDDSDESDDYRPAAAYHRKVRADIMEAKLREKQKKKEIETKMKDNILKREKERQKKILQESLNKKKKEEEQRHRFEASIIITKFLRRLASYRQQKKFRVGIRLLQGFVRGWQTRDRNKYIINRMTEFKQFYKVWYKCLQLLKNDVQMDEPDWASVREKQTYIQQQQHEELIVNSKEEDQQTKTDDKMTNSMMDAMDKIGNSSSTSSGDADDAVIMEEVSGLPTERPLQKPPILTNNSNEHSSNSKVPIIFKKIHLSDNVVKWLKHGDSKYVQFFIRRMKQLSGGERSRILAKRLKSNYNGSGNTTSKTDATVTNNDKKRMPIYETYLEQKSGFRILWTEKNDYLLVWYVAKHKSVSRLMKLIDDSKNRSHRQRISVEDLPEMKDLSIDAIVEKNDDYYDQQQQHEIVLDPLGNVPLKVYDIPTDEMDAIAKPDWTPALNLTLEERDVVESPGTVLLLGRSGTGKTICICNRMEFDRQRFATKDGSFFSQLFVARSPRLCSYVKNNIGEVNHHHYAHNNMVRSEFATFDKILDELEKKLPKVDSIRDEFPESHQMRFSTFKQDIYNGEGGGLDALIVWTNIRSFLKGSIESVQSRKNSFSVSEEIYLSYEKFGRKRCRLSTQQRKLVYEVFLKYQQKTAELNTWDNCDRIIALIQRLIAAKTSNPELFRQQQQQHQHHHQQQQQQQQQQPQQQQQQQQQQQHQKRENFLCKWSKIYVDEVQDYTQAEILLFFHLSGPNNLFLAGDPAQNVTKGVEFRFEEIRSVGYYIAGNTINTNIDNKNNINDNHNLNHKYNAIPQKPKIVTKNFRSHAGILNVAAAILSQMFSVFPDSAKQLGKDDGLFQGPRPGIFHKVKAATISALLNEKMRGFRVLTHDENVQECIDNKLGGYELVYGIRKTKGLEFKNVIVLDFFSSISIELQKPWREMLLGRFDHDFHMDHPEIEGQLKLLYTAGE